MSTVWEWLIAVFALLSGINFHLLVREIARLRRQVARLTRRVWTLEGCPRGDA